MTATLTFSEIREAYPFPWRQEIVMGEGRVRLIDAHDKEVPLFTITGLLVFLTAKMAEGRPTT